MKNNYKLTKIKKKKDNSLLIFFAVLFVWIVISVSPGLFWIVIVVGVVLYLIFLAALIISFGGKDDKEGGYYAQHGNGTSAEKQKQYIEDMQAREVMDEKK